MRILAAGDWHGSVSQLAYIYDTAAQEQADVIVHMGDFGYWEHMPGGAEFLDACQQFADAFSIELWWIDGNHENFDWLYDYPLDKHGRRPVRPNVIHLPRGHVWEWDGVKFMAFGGAFSIDRRHRKLGLSYWEQEMPTWDEVEYAQKQGQVDIMFTHDVPEGTHLAPLLGPDWLAKSKYPAGCVSSRNMLRQVFNSANPELLVHGHYHARATSTLGRCRIEGLAQEDTGEDSWLIIETEDYR